jgi:hypothetical protein
MHLKLSRKEQGDEMAIWVKVPHYPYIFNDPWKSGTILMRKEDAADCEGTCMFGEAWRDPETGETHRGKPHDHLVVTGENPKAGPRWYAVKKEGTEMSGQL